MTFYGRANELFGKPKTSTEESTISRTHVQGDRDAARKMLPVVERMLG